MKKIFTKFKLQMVKEKSGKYEINKNIDSPTAVFEIAKKILEIDLEAEEVLYLLTLNTKNNVTGIFEVSRGALNSSIVHPREIFKRALLNNACSIIIVHNHPSGSSEPSKDDIDVTNRLLKCGELLGVQLLDHIIIADNDFVSLKSRDII